MSETQVLPLTKANLELMGFKEVTPIKPIKPKPLRKTSVTQINKVMKVYNDWLYEFNEGDHMQIYELLTPIAKRKYHKNEELAAFQEEFYQLFINDKKMPGRSQFKSWQIEESDNKLKALRAKADGRL